MNSLPFISHQLFVAAVKPDGRPRRKPIRELMSRTERQAEATDVQLELLTDAQSAPAGALRLEVAPMLGSA
jgi:hypothetical protein